MEINLRPADVWLGSDLFFPRILLIGERRPGEASQGSIGQVRLHRAAASGQRLVCYSDRQAPAHGSWRLFPTPCSGTQAEGEESLSGMGLDTVAEGNNES